MIIAEERAFWMARFEYLEAKLDAREAGKVDVDVPHVSGLGSCSQTANQTLDGGLVGEEVANHVDVKSIWKVCDQLEQNYLCKASKTLREKVRKPISRAQQKKDVIKMVEKAKTNLEDKVLEENMEDNAKPQYVSEQEHEEMEFVDLTVLGDKLKVPAIEIDCKLVLGSIDQIVALATVIKWDNPSQTVHGVPLGDKSMRVSVYCALDEKALVPFLVGDEIQTVKQAMGSWVAWPKDLIVMSLEKELAKEPEKRRKRKKVLQQNQDSEVQFILQKLASILPASLKMLCMWGDEAFKDGHAINFDMEPEVFGYVRKTYIMGTNIRRLASMRELTRNCIVLYQRYLYDVLSRCKMVDMVAFVDPASIGGKGCGNGTMRSQNIKQRLINTKPGQLFMLPYNADSHWTLTVVDLDIETVYFLDPMK